MAREGEGVGLFLRKMVDEGAGKTDSVPILEQARRLFLMDGHHSPIILADLGGRITPVAAVLESDGDKDALAEWLEGHVRLGLLREYVFLCEAWLADGPEALAWKARHGTLEGMPGRREALCAFYGGPGGDEAWTALIGREPLSLAAWEKVEVAGSPLCRFGGFFRKEGGPDAPAE